MSEPSEVLIVEDEPVVLKAAGMALATQGIGFLEALDITGAKALLEYTTFKVVITDLKLPGASGFEVLDLVRRTSPNSQTIIITGYATIDNALRSFELGAFDFIPKPFDLDELTSVVQRALRFFDLERPCTRGPDDRLFLGRHSWARLDSSGSATLGVAETIADVIGPLESFSCQEVDNHTSQGQCCCQLTAADGLSHRVWAPLSGRVILQNPRVAEDIEWIGREPLAAGWLLRIIPSRLEEERTHLAQPRALDTH